MKKLKLIPFTLLGFALAFGAVASIAKAPKNPEVADAAGETFYIGGHNLLTEGPCDKYTGTAVLETVNNEYVLTLTNFNNGSAIIAFGAGGTSYIASSFTFLGASHNLTIKVIGACTINNPNTNTGYDQSMGMFLSTSEQEGINVNIVGVSTNEYPNPSLSITTASYAGYSKAVAITSSGTGGVSNLNIEDCAVNVTAGKCSSSYGFYLSGCALNVSGSKTLNATSNGVNSPDSTINYSSAIYADSYTQNGGVVNATAKEVNVRSEARALWIKNGNAYIKNGTLVAEAKNSAQRSSVGIYLDNGSLILDDGANVTAIAGNIPSIEEGAIGFAVRTKAGSKIEVGAKADKLYMYSNLVDPGYSGRATNSIIESSLDGYGTHTSDIFSDAAVDTIAAGSHSGTETAILTSRQIIFQRIHYSVATDERVTYDGNQHQALTVTVTKPASYSVKYRVGGATEWVTTVPSFDLANENGYDVEFKIEANLYSSVEGSLKFYVDKAAPSVTSVPTLVSTFEADGKTLVPLAVAGVVEGGSFEYSLNGGDFSATIPSVKYAGSYEVSYKVVGDSNHSDSAPVSLGTVIVTGAKAPVPTPDPETPSEKGGLSGGAVAGIVIGSLVFVIGGAYLVLFFLLNKWIKVGDKAVRVLRFALGKKDGKERYLAFNCKFAYRNKEEVFNTKQDALK